MMVAWLAAAWLLWPLERLGVAKPYGYACGRFTEHWLAVDRAKRPKH